MNKCIQETEIPEWMPKKKTTLIQKDTLKRTAPSNYRPITCLPMMWKILTAQIKDKIYYTFTSRGIFPGEQKETMTGGRGNGGSNRDCPDDSMVEIGQNTEKSPGDLRRLVVTQPPEKNHQLKLI